MISGEQDNTTRTLGMLLAVGPETSTFRYAIGLAGTAQRERVQVYLYLLDEAVLAADSREMRELSQSGVKISGCAYAAQRRSLFMPEHIVWGGLKLLNDIIAHSNRFVGFCR